MSISKLDIFEKLIEGYVKAPPSLTDQAIKTLAIQLCQNFELKKNIICESEKLRVNKYSILNSMWEISIEKQLTDMCEKLPLPPALKNLLIVSSRSIVLQLFNWNRQQVMFDFPPLLADSFLTPFDWTVEIRLDEKRIAERLVQDQKIPVYQRYRIACVYCLGLFIQSLWKQMSPKQRKDMYYHKEGGMIELWSYQLAVGVNQRYAYDLAFWLTLMYYGIDEGSRLTVFHCWDKSDEKFRQSVIAFAKRVVFQIYIRKLRKEITGNFLLHYSRLPTLVPYIDILCFLLKQMSEEQRVEFFQEALQDTKHNILVCFLQWPYLDLLIPIIERLWNILPESKYGDLLLSLANHYSIENGNNSGRNDYIDYYYGDLIVVLLEKTPDHFKRYVFSDNYLPYRKTIKAGELLFTLINKKSLKIRNIKIFQNILKHVTLEEKLSFLRSKYGESFCCHLALEENWELLNSMLRECLPENEIARYKMEILMSKCGKESCFQMLSEVNDDRFNSWLNWGFSSEQEIFQFIFKIFFKDQRLDFKNISSFQYIIEINCFDKVIKRYAPSEDAVRNFKSQFVKIYSTNVCINCVIHSKWLEVDRFLTWGFPSQDDRMQFKKWFVKIYAMYLCEYHIAHSNLQNVEKLLTWCFPTIKAIDQFKQEFFLSSGLNCPWVHLSRNLQDLDILIQWFRLGPDALEKFKWKILFCPKTLSTLFDPLTLLGKYPINELSFVEEIFQRDAKFLRWGLNNRRRLIAFLDVSNNYLGRLSFCDAAYRPWIKRTWAELINEIDCDLIKKREKYKIDLSIKRKHEIRKQLIVDMILLASTVVVGIFAIKKCLT